MHGPDPKQPHPMAGHPRVCYLAAVVDLPNIEIGDYTYYDDPNEPERFVEKCVLHHYEELGDRLVIGRFCALATGVRFVMNGADHAMGGFSTYPFHIFGHGWEAGFDATPYVTQCRGDTVVGNDVWIGMGATVLPGSRIGNGAIVGARAVVSGDVPAYAVVAGNPARVVRMRFAPEEIAALQDIAWWNWDLERITRNLAAITGSDLAALATAT